MASTLKQRHNAKPTGPTRDTTSTTTNTKNPKQQQPFRLLDLLDGIGGTVNFSFFQAPSWVDLSLPPGTTSELEMNLEHPKFWDIVTGKSIVYSPNLIWIFITALVYVLAPYDLEQAAANNSWWRPDWFVRRAVLNLSVMLLYYGYWHTVLYGLHWASRPFCQGRVYKWSKLLHNVWYCVLGTLQWTAWEMIMVHLYATGRIGHQRNDEIFLSAKGIANFCACAIFVPLYREIQFFFAHRVIHIRAFYKYIHALHHRNTDVEPFSGLCMSPAEHLYYISSIAPSVYWHASPFQFLWNGIHLLLSPGASHSGWEDHWHSDQFHVAHHRYFECNYGTPGMPFDRWFGCFRETMAPTTRVYVGDADECKSMSGSAVIMARVDAKSTLWGLPSWDQMVYMAATGIGLPLFVIHVASLRDNATVNNPWYCQATIAAFVVSVGPLILAALLSIITAGPSIWSSKEKWQSTLLYPFHKESLWGRFGITLFMGTILSILPTFHFFHSLFVPNPNDTIYNQIWNRNSA